MEPLSTSLTHPFPGTGNHNSQPSQLAADDNRRSLVATPLPFPDVEGLSDSEYPDWSENGNDHDASITQPTRAFFLGVRRTKLLSPRGLEEARLPRQPSSSTLSDDHSIKSEMEKSKTKSLIPEIDPLEYHGLDSSPLPPKKGSRVYRYLRWNFGSVYRRVFCLAFLGNMAALAFLLTGSIMGRCSLTYQQAGTAVTANLLAAMVVRNEHFVNALFWIFGTWSRRLPFWARKLVAKVYSYGGIHSGGAVAATFWYIAYLVLLTLDFKSRDISVIRSYIYFVSYGILFLLVSMLIFAHPHLRVVMHNWFEGIHRFMGWSVVLLFWAQTMLLSADVVQSSNNNITAFGRALLLLPNFWMLIVITLLVIYPWTRMRLRDVEAEVLSPHCVKLNFKYRNVHYGQAIRLTDAPLKETHAFGVVPFPSPPKQITHCPGCNCHLTNTSTTSLTTSMSELRNPLTLTRPQPPTPITTPNPTGKGFSVYISSAGDWTSRIIANPPTKIYTRGTPQFGVLRCASLFTPVIIVATGSGIAPCLSLFAQKPDHPVRIIWSAASPLETYGREVVELIYRTDPGAVVIDTRRVGRPDLVKVVYRVWEGSRNESVVGGGQGQKGRGGGACEAVVIISNQKVTRKVVYGLDSRGVPAYGAIFDS